MQNLTENFFLQQAERLALFLENREFADNKKDALLFLKRQNEGMRELLCLLCAEWYKFIPIVTKGSLLQAYESSEVGIKRKDIINSSTKLTTIMSEFSRRLKFVVKMSDFYQQEINEIDKMLAKEKEIPSAD